MPVFVSTRLQGAPCPRFGASLPPSFPFLRTTNRHVDASGAHGTGCRLSVSSRCGATGHALSGFEGIAGNA